MSNELKSQTAQKVSPVEKIMLASFILIGLFIKSMWTAAMQKSTWSKGPSKFWLGWFVLVPVFAYAPAWDIPTILDALSWFFPSGSGEWVYHHLTPTGQSMAFTIVPFMLWLVGVGSIRLITIRKYQNSVDHIGLKNAYGIAPRVVNVIDAGNDQKKIVLKAIGFDLADFEKKKSILRSALNHVVLDIRHPGQNHQVVEVTLSKSGLPNNVSFETVSLRLTEPFSFVVGDGPSGTITTNLQKVHHMMVAGATGNGKSFFVKQVLVGLLQTSDHLQLYLLDLKRGVEMKVFEKLKNVVIAKDNTSAGETLSAVVQEMERRFTYLEKHGYTEIDCKRDKLDRIVILVDEASELFTVVKSSKETKAEAEYARDLAEKISKLGRVAGIHLILATQRVVKDTIDTRIQTNVNARMIFRVNTDTASMTVLGNAAAANLPQIPGRGIWSVGSHETQLQTPKLTNEEVSAKVKILMEKFNANESPLFQKLLTPKAIAQIRRQQTEDETVDATMTIDQGVSW